MKKKIFIPILLFAVLIVAVYLVLPQYQKYRANKEEINLKNSQLAKTEEYFTNLQKIKDDLAKYKKSLEKIEAGLPKDISLPFLLNFFSKKSSENGLFIKSMALGQEAPNEKEESSQKTQDAYFVLEVSGTYPSLKNFVKNLENSSRLVEIETISIRKEKPTDLFLTFDVKIKAKSFKQ